MMAIIETTPYLNSTRIFIKYRVSYADPRHGCRLVVVEFKSSQNFIDGVITADRIFGDNSIKIEKKTLSDWTALDVKTTPKTEHKTSPDSKPSLKLRPKCQSKTITGYTVYTSMF
jgi:hypothetical protein